MCVLLKNLKYLLRIVGSTCSKLTVLLIISIALAAGCAALKQYGKLERSARQHYVAGRFDSAVFDCVKSLRLNPKYEKAQILLQDAFRAAVKEHEREIRRLEGLDAKFKWDNIVREYEALIKVNEAVSDLPTLIDKRTGEIIKFNIKDYTAHLTEAKSKAAEAHYQEGLRLSKLEGIEIQKQAAKEFKKALSFVPGYKDAEVRYEESRRAGIKRMAIIPFADKSGKRGKYGALSEMITDDIISAVMNNPSAREFLELISRAELEQVLQEQKLGLTGLLDEKTAAELGKILGVHEIVTGQITQIIYEPARTTRRNERQKKTITVKTGKDQYTESEVNATVTFYKKQSRARIEGSYKIIDVRTARL